MMLAFMFLQQWGHNFPSLANKTKLDRTTIFLPSVYSVKLQPKNVALGTAYTHYTHFTKSICGVSEAKYN